MLYFKGYQMFIYVDEIVDDVYVCFNSPFRDREI